MKFSDIFIVLFVFIGLSLSAIRHDNFIDIPDDLTNNMRELASQTKHMNDFTTCNVVYSINQYRCTDTYRLYMKFSTKARFVINLSIRNYTMPYDFVHDTEATETLIFINSISEFKHTFYHYVTSKFFHNKGNYKIVFCTEIIADVSLLYDLAKLVWAYRVLNFVFIYYDGVGVREAQYNPFTDDLFAIRITDIKENYEEYPDKLRNMNGYPFHVLSYPNLIDPENIFFDFDWNFAQALKTSLNATLIYHNIDTDDSNVINVLYYLTLYDVELCINTEAMSKRNIPEIYLDTVDLSYPHMINNVVVLVPKPKKFKRWTYIFLTLNKTLLGVILICCVLSAYLNKILSSDRNREKMDIGYFLFTICKVPVVKRNTKKTIIKASWIIFTLFIGILAENFSLETLLTEKFQSDLQTIHDLKDSGLKAYVAYFKNFSTSVVNLPIPYTVVPKSKWMQMIFKNDGTAAFIGTYVEIDRIIKLFANKHIEFKYKYLPEIVLPKFGIFPIKKKTPYFNKIGKMGAKIGEFSISSKVPFKKFQTVHVPDVMMKFEHFLGIFVILGVGHTIAMLVFALELCWVKMNLAKKHMKKTA